MFAFVMRFRRPGCPEAATQPEAQSASTLEADMTSSRKRPNPEHREALLLAWKSMHVPVGTFLIGTLLLSGAASAITMVWGYAPSIIIP